MMGKVVELWFLFLAIVGIGIAQDDPIVATKYGKIEGFRFETPKGFKAEVFLGIPYASPPIGELRFEKPQPPTPWSEPLKAKEFKAACATYASLFSNNTTSEDCLTLNIVKPQTPSSNPKGYPVMVWIHGGAFIVGSARDYNYDEVSDRLVSRGIVLVTINYRLGPYGFYSTGDSTAPGNYGLWDQVEALKFIQAVISSFGGNPAEVTIFGESAGGASVSWLTLSPATKDLFLRAIPQSGSASAPWASSEDVIGYSSQLTKAAGCEEASNPKDCLKKLSTAEIEAATQSYLSFPIKSDAVNFGYFYPRWDGDFVKAKTMEEAVKEAPKKSHFMGLCSQEHIMMTVSGQFGDPKAQILPFSREKAAVFAQNNFTELIERLVATEEFYGSRAPEAAKKIAEFYKTQTKLYSKNHYLQAFTQLLGDIMFHIPPMREALWKARAGHDVYFYLYNFQNEVFKNDLFDGASHGADALDIFGSFANFPAPKQEGDVVKVQKTFGDLFSSFAINGTPTSGALKAPKIDASHIPYVEIDSKSSLKDNLWPERVKFWNDMAKEFGFDWPSAQKIAFRDEL